MKSLHVPCRGRFVSCAACLAIALAMGCSGEGGNQPCAASPSPRATPSASVDGGMATAVPSATPVPGVQLSEIAADDRGGMWLFNRFPSDKVGREFGFSPDQPWLDHVRLSSIRLGRGCSGSMVSPSGLVMTNHHCAHRCIEQISNAKNDHVANGFYAAAEKDEVACPALEADQLVEITDVTDRVNAVTRGLSDRDYNIAQKAEMSKIEKECASSDQIRCDVVSLYHGGFYHLYKYRRFQDLRLVFAPEFSVAFFGGDPDNFMFPRYDLDVTFLRIYDGGKPASMQHYLKWSPAGVRGGDLAFVSGHPGSTSRSLTVAEVEYQRDTQIPARLLRLTEARGMLREFQKRGKEQKRISSATLFYVENGIKALKGRRDALLDREVFSALVKAEQALRAKVQSDPAMKLEYGDAWGAIAAAQQELVRVRKPYTQIEQGAAFWSDLFSFARTLVRAAEETGKPNEKRLREYVDSQMPAVKQQLFSTAPIDDEFEILTLALSLTQMREELGIDDPVVRKILGRQSPRQLATALVKGTALKDLKVRRRLFDGGKAAVDGSKDPLIELARKIDVDARQVRTKYEDNIEGVVKKNSEIIARARFKIYGTRVYPDATFTLRLSFGVVKGWNEDGREVAPLTTIGGAFERATGEPPFALPKSWLAAKNKLDLTTPLDFCSTNDIVGGNSGSPVIDRNAEVVGLIFDGNIHSLGGDYVFDEAKNRAVSVHSSGLLEALDKIYGATRIRDELKPISKK